MNEIWKPIKGYENRYLISDKGEVKSIKHNKILKKELRRNYWSVQLFNGVKYKHFSIHRLVGLNFIDNPDNLPYINHKDENKLNNNVNNLEWCTCSYNINYGTSITRSKEKKSVSILKLSKNGEILNTYNSISDAEKETGIYNSNIVKCCKGERKTAGGYIWKYNEAKEEIGTSKECNS